LSLGNRLNLLASFSGQAESVWDIGCDHGLLGLSYLPYPLIKEIHLVDPSGHVMKSLKEKLKDAYITKTPQIHLHQKKGQEIKLNQKSKTIFIAGMGGREIHEILGALENQVTSLDRIIISPHRWVFELRKELSTSDFRLFDETIAFESGHFYQILCLIKTPELAPVHPFGNKLWSSPNGRSYRDHLIKGLYHHRDALSRDLVDFLRHLSI
jgi:tRNA A22 N-methylase